MFRKLEKILLRKFPFAFTKTILVGDAGVSVGKIDTDLYVFGSLESAFEHIRKQHPKFYRRFQVLLYGYNPDDNNIIIPPYCEVIAVPKKEGVYRISRNFRIIVEGNLFPNRFALF